MALPAAKAAPAMPFASQPHGGGILLRRPSSPLVPAAALRLGPLFWPWEKVKVGPLSVSPMGFGTLAWGNQLLWGYEESMDSELSSLERLQINRLGIGQLHWSTANYAPLQERALWDGLVEMYDKGLVRAVGVSNYGPKQLLKIHSYLASRGVPLSSAQVQFSLLSMGDEQMELKTVCDSLGVRVIAYSPLGLGMLTGKYDAYNLPDGPRSVLFRQILPGLKSLLSCLKSIADRKGKTMSQVAINWCICKGAIPIPSVKTVRHVEDNLGALGWRLSADEISELEAAAMESPKKMVQNIFQTA
ncbi:hypothetical protein ACQ4PT_011764 [Festuca glaucescens]